MSTCFALTVLCICFSQRRSERDGGKEYGEVNEVPRGLCHLTDVTTWTVD